jgi:hypothetical protein
VVVLRHALSTFRYSDKAFAMLDFVAYREAVEPKSN